jgi:hypothetical protein
MSRLEELVGSPQFLIAVALLLCVWGARWMVWAKERMDD